YDDDIVIVSPALGGSTVRVEDLDDRYRGGFFAFLGAGFRPGAPGTGSAMTAMTATSLPAGGWTWQSWHLYPGKRACSIVTTRSKWTPP
ncbi:MAG TPA: DUF2617 family protein, partial [Pseudonocardiaceae bacterium]